MFEELFNEGLLIWIDLLGYADGDDGLLRILTRVLEICAAKGLKLNPEKCALYLREALWCGRIIYGDNVHHDPARIDALTHLPPPPPATGQELQQFICALNWMRQSIRRTIIGSPVDTVYGEGVGIRGRSIKEPRTKGGTLRYELGAVGR